MKYEITCDNLQTLTIQPGANERIHAEAGAMIHMSGGMKMESKARGGLIKGIGRRIAGESFSLTEFTHRGNTGTIAGNATGKIKHIHACGDFVEMKVDAGCSFDSSVDYDVESDGSEGVPSGEGLFLPRLTGRR
jgi:uncharacterized protein (AIM24 family)